MIAKQVFVRWMLTVSITWVMAFAAFWLKVIVGVSLEH